jgi:exonuclease SbcC
MRFETVLIHEMKPFRDVEIDFTQIDGKLVAITGDNGEGKTVLLELLTAALYRTCPTRGSVSELAMARDSFVEARVVNGAAYTIRQSADAISGRSEAMILDADGQPQLESSSVRASDAWMAKHFPSSEVAFAGPFLAQRSAGFVDLKASGRKDVLLRLLQIERYERLAATAREHAREAKALVESTLARLEELHKRYPSVPDTEQAQASAEAAVADAQAFVASTQAALSKAQEAAGRSQARPSIERRIAERIAALAEIDERIANNKKLLAQADQIESSHARFTQAQKELQAMQATAELERVALQRAREAITQCELRCREAIAARQKADGREEAAQARVSAARVQESAAKKLPAARQNLCAVKAQIAALSGEIEELEQAQLTHKDARITGLRAGLKRIGQKEAKPAELASETLSADDGRKAEASAAPAKLAKARKQLDAAETRLERIQEEVAELRAHAAREKDLDAAKAELAAASAEVRATETARTQAASALEHARAELTAAQNAQKARIREYDALMTQSETASALAKFYDLMLAARLRLEEHLEPQRAREQAQLEADQAELALLPARDSTPLSVYEAQHELAARRKTEASDQLARARERAQAAREGVALIEARTAELATQQDEQSNWTRIASDLGKDGLQALEIDAAIPAINTMANDLLHSCHGPRFTVELKTDRLHSDGKRLIEDLDIRVIDARKGYDGLIERLSGGQNVIVGEAVSLALTMLGCMRAGVSRPTLIRDESGAALDSINGPVYIAMLRRAAELIGADKVLFVTHNPELQALADARIHIRDGRATVEQDA